MVYLPTLILTIGNNNNQTGGKSIPGDASNPWALTRHRVLDTTFATILRRFGCTILQPHPGRCDATYHVSIYPVSHVMNTSATLLRRGPRRLRLQFAILINVKMRIPTYTHQCHIAGSVPCRSGKHSSILFSCSILHKFCTVYCRIPYLGLVRDYCTCQDLIQSSHTLQKSHILCTGIILRSPACFQF